MLPLEDLHVSLTTDEISKLLSEDCCHSKALMNDLFWEAVWPRLLARGWHSEEVNSRHVASSSSNSSSSSSSGSIPSHILVFLKPGVKRFARRKMASGDQYFASETDVLRKVAREPGLLELGPEWTIETLKDFQSAATISRDKATILGNKCSHNSVAVDQEAPPPDTNTVTILGNERSHNGMDVDQEAPRPDANAALVHKTPKLKIKFQFQPSQ